jgi:hypothetical protein
MFEELEKEEGEEKESRKKLLWMSALVVAALVVVGILVYVIARPRTRTPVSVQSAAPAGQAAPADPVKDLQIVRALMGKDVTGVRVLWSIQLRNKSSVYTYSDIQYEASFISPDGRTLGTNRDTIKDSIGPGEEKKFPPFVDGLYDANSSTFQFRLTGAKATVQ